MCKVFRDDLVVMKAKDLVEDFKLYLPLIQEACNPAMQAHHWAQVGHAEASFLGVRRTKG